MPTNTPNLNLIKPLVSENYDVGVFNSNADLIDSAVKSVMDDVSDAQDDIELAETNISSLQSSVASIIALLGLGGIESEGSNADGNFIRFESGFMICWGVATAETTSTNALSNGGFRSGIVTRTLPSTFIATPVVLASIGSSVFDMGIFADSTATNNYRLAWKTVNSDATTRVHTASWIALGRWKA